MIQFGSQPRGPQPRAALSQRRTSSLCPEGGLRTLGSPPLALFVQAQDGGTSDSSPIGFFGLVASTTTVGKIVLLILGLLSIVSWAIILYKWFTFARAARQSA